MSGALDLFQGDANAAIARAATASAPDMPSGFTENFEAAWNAGRLFNQSIARSNARAAVLADYLSEIKEKTGNDLSKEFVPDLAGGGQTGVTDFETANEKVAKLKEKFPDLDLEPLSDEEIDKRAVGKSREAMADYTRLAQREKTWGGTAGFIAGNIAGAATDPINIAALPVAPAEGLGLLATALRWGGIAAGTQFGVELAGQNYREQVQPGYTESGAPLGNIAEAGIGGAFLGGAIKGLGNLWTRAKTGAWPTSIRDAGNVVESEANLQNSNIYPGADGEAAHRAAMAKAGEDIIKGNPVDVEDIITPELQAAREERFAPLMEARERAQAAARDIDKLDAAKGERAPELPFEQTARADDLEGHIGDMAFQLQRIAREQGHELSRRDAGIAAERMVKAPDEQVHADIDRLLQSPSTLAERQPLARAEPGEASAQVSSDVAQAMEPKQIERDLTSNDQATALRTGLDRLRAEKDMMVHMDVDKDGNPVMQSLDKLLDGIDQDRAAAMHIESCINPAPGQEAA